MKHVRRIISLALSLILLVTSVAFANEEVYATNNDEGNYTLKTIAFSADKGKSFLRTRGKNGSSIEINSVAETPQERYEATKEFVENLDYGDEEAIKEAILEDLECINNAGAEIEEYTVYLPIATTSMTQVIPIESKNGYDFYGKILAERTVNVIKNTENSKSKIKKFVSGILDIVFCFLSAEISVPYSTAKSILGLPSNVSVSDGDTVESIIKLTSRVKEVYIKDIMMRYGNNPNAYVRIYSGDSGVARPFMRIGFSANSAAPEKSSWVGKKIDCETDHYKDTDQFIQIYNFGTEAVEKLVTRISSNGKISWK